MGARHVSSHMDSRALVCKAFLCCLLHGAAGSCGATAQLQLAKFLDWTLAHGFSYSPKTEVACWSPLIGRPPPRPEGGGCGRARARGVVANADVTAGEILATIPVSMGLGGAAAARNSTEGWALAAALLLEERCE